METSDEVVPTENSGEPACVNCGVVLGFTPSKTALCDNCRNTFIKYPIPIWIKLFGGALLIILLFSLIFIGKDLQTGIHYQRGLDAANAKNYMTAEKEFQTVVAKESNYQEAQCRLLLAAYYNDDMPTVISVFNKIKNQEVKDQTLFSDVSSVLEEAGQRLPSDSFNILLDNHKEKEVSEEEYTSYLSKNNNDIYAAYSYAFFLNDQNRYHESDSMLTGILTIHPHHPDAISLKIPVKRELGELDSANYYVDRLLKLNKENVYALSSRVRILLKQKKDDEALALGKKCILIDDKNAHALCSLALAYHYKNDFKNRDILIGQLVKDSNNVPVVEYVQDVISGKEKFRN